MKILIVDDEPLFLELIDRHLAAIGYTDTHLVTSGSEALDRIGGNERAFDCCLLDIRMAGMDGIELCRKIRAVPGYGATPIIMITSMTEKSFVDEAFKAGANDYVTKPIDSLEIEARMGMVESLVAERTQSGLLLRQLDDAEHSVSASINFESPIDLLDTDGVVPYSNLENYVLRLGNLRLFSSVALGFHLDNGAEIFARTSGLEFADILGEVALAINEALSSSRMLLSYAGSGDFCGILPRLALAGRDEMEFAINDEISRRLFFLKDSDISMPTLTIGQPQSNGLFSFRDPTYILYKAIADARNEPVGEGRSAKSGGWRKIHAD